MSDEHFTVDGTLIDQTPAVPAGLTNKFLSDKEKELNMADTYRITSQRSGYRVDCAPQLFH